MKHITLVAFCAVLIMSWQGCSDAQDKNTNDESRSDQFTAARLVQVDSIMIDVMGRLSIYDYNAETDLFLAGDIAGATLSLGGAKHNVLGHLVINRSGEIIHQFKHTGNGPEEHGRRVHQNFFIDNESIGALSVTGLHQYSLDGTFIKKYRELNTKDITGHADYNAVGVNNAGMMAVGLTKRVAEGESTFQTIEPMRFYDLSRFETGYEPEEAFLVAKYGYPDHMIYSPENHFSQFRFPPRVTVNRSKDEAYALYPDIPNLQVYSMKDGTLKANIDLKPDHFGDYVEQQGENGLLWHNTGGKVANSHYQDLIQLGDYTLLRYTSAMPSQAVRELIAGGFTALGRHPEWPTLRRKYFKSHFQLIKNGEKLLPDFQLPILEPREGEFGFNGTKYLKGKIIGGNGLDEIFVFIPNQGEEERDYELIRVYKLELTKE